MWVIWLLAALILIGLDAHAQAFYAVFLGLGAIVACIASIFDAPLWSQGVLFALVGAMCIVFLRPPAVKWLDGRSGTPTAGPGATHAGFVGQVVLTLVHVGDEQHPGHVHLANERWLAVPDVDGGVPPST